MTGGAFDPDENFDTEAADRATRRGLQIAFWGGCAVIVLAIVWPFVRGLIAPAVVLAICVLALWRFRDAAPVKALRGLVAYCARRALDALFAVFLRRPYAHVFEKAAHERQARDTAGEIARIADAESAQIPTAEAGVFVSQARAAMEERLEQLLLVPKPTLAEHREREQIAAWLRRDRERASALLDPAEKPETRTQKPEGVAVPARLLSGTGISGFWFLASGFLRSAQLWLLGALVALSGGLYARGEKLKADARREHTARVVLSQEREAWRARAARWERAYGDAAAAVRANANRMAQEAAASAEHLAAAQRRNQKLAEDLRRIHDETSNSSAGADPRDSLRVLSEPVDPGAARARAGAGDPTAGADPGP
jgi:hypothetical protein